MNRGDVKITLITVVLNASATLPETLRSVSRQTCTPYEHIIIDGQSTDNSVALCEEYSRQMPYSVKIYILPPHGVYDAINQGIDRATGNVIGLVHGDDRLYSRDVLRLVADAFNDDDSLEMVYGDVVYRNKNGNEGRYFSGKYFNPHIVKWGHIPPHPSIYTKNTLHKKYGKYSLEYKVAADFEWIVRVIHYGSIKMKYLPMCMVSLASGGLSSKWQNRLYFNCREKLRGLRNNDMRINPLCLAGRYYIAIKTIFTKRNV